MIREEDVIEFQNKWANGIIGISKTFTNHGDYVNEARKYHFKLLKSVDMFYVEGNPVGVKQALYMQGLISSNQVRLPLLKMSKNNANKFRKIL